MIYSFSLLLFGTKWKDNTFVDLLNNLGQEFVYSVKSVKNCAYVTGHDISTAVNFKTGVDSN